MEEFNNYFLEPALLLGTFLCPLLLFKDYEFLEISGFLENLYKPILFPDFL